MNYKVVLINILQGITTSIYLANNRQQLCYMFTKKKKKLYILNSSVCFTRGILTRDGEFSSWNSPVVGYDKWISIVWKVHLDFSEPFCYIKLLAYVYFFFSLSARVILDIRIDLFFLNNVNDIFCGSFKIIIV